MPLDCSFSVRLGAEPQFAPNRADLPAAGRCRVGTKHCAPPACRARGAGRGDNRQIGHFHSFVVRLAAWSTPWKKRNRKSRPKQRSASVTATDNASGRHLSPCAARIGCCMSPVKFTVQSEHRRTVTYGVAAEVHRYRQAGDVAGIYLHVHRERGDPSSEAERPDPGPIDRPKQFLL